MVHNKFSVILILIASAIAPVVAPPPPVTPVTGQGSHVHLDIQHSPPTSPSHSPRIEASTSHHTGPVHATPPVTSVTPQVGGNSDRSHIQESFHGHSSSHNTAHNPEFVQGSSKKRKLSDAFDESPKRTEIVTSPGSPEIEQQKGKKRDNRKLDDNSYKYWTPK